MKRVVFFQASLWPYEMKIHFRFFLSHDNSEKYQYFMKKVCILRKFRFMRRHNAPSYDVTGKGARNCSKKCYVTCVILENL